MWVLAATAVSFALTFILTIRKIPFGVSLLIGSVLLGLLTLSSQALAASVAKTLTDPVTAELVLTTILIASLGYLYEKTGKLRELAENLEQIISDKRAITMLVPALFGMLPMYGGALLSAPVLNVEGEKLKMNNSRRAYVNLWFRHTPHFIYPLSSSMIFAAYLSGINALTIALWGLPACITAIAAGYLIGLRSVDARTEKHSMRKGAVRNVLVLVSPIALAVVLSFVVGLKVFISVALGLLLLILVSRASPVTVLSVVKKAGLSRLVLAIIAAVIFRGIVYAANLPNIIADLTQGTAVPWTILTAVIPLSLGSILGDITAPIAISVPIISALTPLNPFSMGLIFSFALLGYIISPLHLCLIATTEYFNAKTTDVYRLLLPTALATMVTTVIFASLI